MQLTTSRSVSVFSLLFSLFMSDCLFGSDTYLQRLPDEIEAVGGQGTAQSQAGSVALNDTAALRLNPAMLATRRSYDLMGGYYWPSAGRPFYKAGVIDGVTSPIAMGFEYTGFQEQLKPLAQRQEIDSPVSRRISLGLAVPSQLFALGFAAHYVESEDITVPEGGAKPLKAIALGAGLLVPIGTGARIGVSIENFNNKRIAAVAPTTLRAGLSWEDSSKVLLVSADYRQRQRSKILERPIAVGSAELAEPTVPVAAADNLQEMASDPEKMGFVGMQATIYNLLRFFSSYGQSLNGEDRSVVSGGLGLYQKNYTVAYAVSKKFPRQTELESSLQLSVIMKL